MPIPSRLTEECQSTVGEEIIHRHVDPSSVVVKHLFPKIRTFVGEFVEDFIAINMSGLEMRGVKPVSIAELADGIGPVDIFC
jgi:hypothetical protein